MYFHLGQLDMSSRRNGSRRNGAIDVMGIDEMRVDELGSRRSGMIPIKYP